MRKIKAIAGVAGLALMTAACSGGGSEPAGDAATTEEPVAEETAATADETPAEDTAAADLDPMATTDGITFASLTGDAGAGKVVFAQCQSCHAVEEGVNKVGPSLAGIIGREAGSVDGYKYSPANSSSGLTWSEEQLYVYLENPQRVIPKTKMIYPGLREAQKRADVIAYLKNPV
ncbi:c-type cytochrome [Pontixanthobacter sp.]|uniref:c-type cytochrome n=1 Tax=Pontixanthobacter sp. TaxID=2792078 RepID=UPI003C7ABB61